MFEKRLMSQMSTSKMQQLQQKSLFKTGQIRAGKTTKHGVRSVLSLHDKGENQLL